MKKQLVAAVLAGVTLAATAPAFAAGDTIDDMQVQDREAKPSSVQWGGDLTIIHYALEKDTDDDVTTFEFRLTAAAQINDRVSVKARLTTDEFDISGDERQGYAEHVAMDNLYVATQVDGFDVHAGRFDVTLGQGLIYDDTLNAVAVAKGRVFAAVGGQYDGDYDLSVIGINGIKAGVVNLGLNYARMSPDGGAADANIWGADLGFDLGKVGITTQYAKSDAGGNPDAIRLDAQLGESPVTLGYQRIETGSITPESALDWIYWDFGSGEEGTKGWDITYSKDVAKNITFTMKYSDMKGVDSGLKEQEIRTTLEFIF